MHAQDCAATFHLYFYIFFLSRNDFFTVYRKILMLMESDVKLFCLPYINALYTWIEKS